MSDSSLSTVIDTRHVVYAPAYIRIGYDFPPAGGVIVVPGTASAISLPVSGYIPDTSTIAVSGRFLADDPNAALPTSSTQLLTLIDWKNLNFVACGVNLIGQLVPAVLP